MEADSARGAAPETSPVANDPGAPSPASSGVGKIVSRWKTTPLPGRGHRSWRDDGAAGWLGFAGVVGQLALVTGVLLWLQLESARGLTRPVEAWWNAFDPRGAGLISLLALGFVGHALLPMRWRMPASLGLSLTGIVLILGTHAGMLVILFGLGLLGLCHLPVAFAWRVALVLAAGSILALVRGGVVEATGIPPVVLPVLASLFMFRLIIYLYDLRHERAGVTPWQRLSYFFLAPNVCFPLFPVVDYTTFLRTWYDGPELRIYQKGVRWMSRGVVHLVLYRVIYHHLAPGVEEVRDLPGVALFVVSSYLLYLRISGQFHLIIGLLCLFGFNLPETHHRYLLASGFSDYWRRINIYWKDFMMKVVFYPAYMRFKGLGMAGAVALGTALVFLATWFLHGYQWFWLRGTVPFSLVDGLFWTFFAVFVIINAVHEVRRKKAPARQAAGGGSGRAFDFPAAAKRSVQTGAMFLLICLLFSFWQSETIERFTGMMTQATKATPAEVLTLLGLVFLALAIGVLIPWAKHLAAPRFAGAGERAWWPAFATVAPLGLVVLAGSEGFRKSVDGRAGEWLASIRATSLNERDQRRLERGYYEGLLGGDSFGSPLWEVRLEQKPGWQPMDASGMSQMTGDLLHHELVPSQDTMINGVRWVTNRWGMHDHDSYTREKPRGVYRIAMLSASYGAGYGMPVEATFENVVEEALNRHPGLTADRIEILNFSVPGYTLIEFVAFLETRIAAFEPDAFHLVTHSKEGPRTLGTLARRIREGVPLVYPFLLEIPERAELPENPSDQDLRRISRYRDEIEEWGYGRMVDFCHRHGMTPVWIHLPVTDEEVDGEARARQRDRAGEAGFIPLLLERPYGEGDPSEIWISNDDRHPNEEGHRRIAANLLEVLRANAAEIGLPVEEESTGTKR